LIPTQYGFARSLWHRPEQFGERQLYLLLFGPKWLRQVHPVSDAEPAADAKLRHGRHRPQGRAGSRHGLFCGTVGEAVIINPFGVLANRLG
jgi:hypothetical protein